MRVMKSMKRAHQLPIDPPLYVIFFLFPISRKITTTPFYHKDNDDDLRSPHIKTNHHHNDATVFIAAQMTSRHCVIGKICWVRYRREPFRRQKVKLREELTNVITIVVTLSQDQTTNITQYLCFTEDVQASDDDGYWPWVGGKTTQSHMLLVSLFTPLSGGARQTTVQENLITSFLFRFCYFLFIFHFVIRLVVCFDARAFGVHSLPYKQPARTIEPWTRGWTLSTLGLLVARLYYIKQIGPTLVDLVLVFVCFPIKLR